MSLQATSTTLWTLRDKSERREGARTISRESGRMLLPPKAQSVECWRENFGGRWRPFQQMLLRGLRWVLDVLVSEW